MKLDNFIADVMLAPYGMNHADLPEANTHELRIAYSQNGRILTDELFRTVPFFWKKQDELDAKAKARELAASYGCGMVDVYILSPQRNRTGIYSAYGMDFRQSA